jgi:iron complex outermembrane receptor protein
MEGKLTKINLKALLHAGTVLALAGAFPAFAQSNAAPPQPAAPDEISVQDIVVTAQRRSERLQDVPISISVVGGATLERQNMQGLRELSRLVPSLVLAQSTGVVTPFLRGTGNSSSSPGNEASIPVYVDGVYYARLSTYLLKLNSVDHIEVLKGPQGTLFGRNASGGLIHVVTKDPSDRRTAEMSLGYANYQTLDGSLYLSGPIADTVRANLSIVGSKQSKGWGTNPLTGKEVRKEKYITIRSKIAADPWDGGELMLSGYFLKARGDKNANGGAPLQGTTVGNPTNAAPAIFNALADFYDYRATIPIVEYTTSYGATGKFKQDLPFATLVSISDYHRGTYLLYNDVDFVPGNFLNIKQVNKFNQYSQEVQLLSLPDDKLKWAAGLYYLRSSDGLSPAYQWGLNFGGNGIKITSRQVARSLAGYGQATYEIASRLNVTLGARYTKDRISATGHVDPVRVSGNVARPDFTILSAGTVVTGKDTSEKFTWKAGADYKISDKVLGYATVSTGYKAGIFNIVPFTNRTALKPEEMTAYEVGVKSTMGRLRLNLAAYWYDQRNLQVGQTIATGSGLSALLTNAGSARNKGIEIDGDLEVVRGLSVNFGMAYADGHYKKYLNAQKTAPNSDLVNGAVPGCAIRATVNINPANGGNVEFCPFDASGKRLIRAPKWSGNVGVAYRIEAADGAVWDLGADMTFTSRFFWDAANSVAQSAYAVVGARVRYQLPGNGPYVQLWGKNLLEKKYYLFVFPQSGPSGTGVVPAEPRSYGVTVGFKM